MTEVHSEKSFIDLLRYFISNYPGKSALMLICQIAAGFAEGIGIVSLIPLFGLMGSDESVMQSPISAAFLNIMSSIGLQTDLVTLLGILVFGMLMRSVFLMLAMREVGYTVAHVATDLRLNLLRNLLRARWSYFSSLPTGKISNAFGSEVERAAMAYYSLCLILAQCIQVAVYLVFAIMISWVVALAALVAGSVLVICLRWLIRLGRQAGGKQTQLLNSLAARLSDGLRGIKPLKAMGREDGIGPLLERDTHLLNQALRDQVFTKEAINSLQEPILVLFLAMGIFFGVTYFGHTISNMMMLALVFQRITSRLGSIQRQQVNLSITQSAFWSLQGSIQSALKADEHHFGKAMPQLQQAIRLQDISFAHENKPILDSLSMEIRTHRVTALTGASGSGKTTLVDLLMGLHQPCAGNILLDNTPLNQIDIKAWRDRIGYVPQETFIFNDTVFHNVTLGDDCISRADVEHALRLSGAWDFVSAFASGLDEQVGETGMKLSGGQRQRLAIARAIVRRPLLLILDEATSALDPITEQSIHETIRTLAGTTTIVVVSHQASLTQLADEVFMVAQGKATLMT